MSWQFKPVSFSANSLVHEGDTASYTIKEGNTFDSLARAISAKTGKSLKECYADILKNNPEITDPNKIKKDQTIKFTYSESLSSFCMSGAPSSDKREAERDATTGGAIKKQTGQFGGADSWTSMISDECGDDVDESLECDDATVEENILFMDNTCDDDGRIYMDDEGGYLNVDNGIYVFPMEDLTLEPSSSEELPSPEAPPVEPDAPESTESSWEIDWDAGPKW